MVPFSSFGDEDVRGIRKTEENALDQESKDNCIGTVVFSQDYGEAAD